MHLSLTHIISITDADVPAPPEFACVEVLTGQIIPCAFVWLVNMIFLLIPTNFANRKLYRRPGLQTTGVFVCRQTRKAGFL
jgi:hypothetical protein